MHAFIGWFLKAEAFFQISLEFPFIGGQWLLIKVKSRFFPLVWKLSQCLQLNKGLTTSNKYLFRESCNYAFQNAFMSFFLVHNEPLYRHNFV